MNGSVVIVGGGIGGLAAGIALVQAGARVTVHERADRVSGQGAGLSIWPNGVRALRSLGLDNLVDSQRLNHGGGALRRPNGAVLAEFDPAKITARYGDPLVAMDRGTLLQALVDRLGPGHLVLGSDVQPLPGDRLRLADGTELGPDLTVGADGLRSAVRSEILGDGEPADSGIVAYRGVSEWERPVPAGEWWGRESVAGLLPLPDCKVYWYLAHRGDPEPGSIARFLGEYGEPLPAVVAATPADRVLSHRLYDRAPAGRWSRGATTLLGDAAHPMLPFLGQGACSALEDAVELGRAAAAADDVPQAIAAYEAQRVGRAKVLVEGSRRAAKVALLRSSTARSIRNALISRLPAGMRLRQLDSAVGR